MKNKIKIFLLSILIGFPFFIINAQYNDVYSSEFINYLASKGRNLQKIESWLLNQGVDPNVRYKENGAVGWTAVHFAASRFSPKLLKILIQYGAYCGLTDDLGNNPLHTLLYCFNYLDSKIKAKLLERFKECVYILLVNGADANYKNRYGKSPNELARKLKIIGSHCRLEDNYNYNRYLALDYQNLSDLTYDSELENIITEFGFGSLVFKNYMQNLFKLKSDFGDFTITVGGKLVKCHKFVLAARSDFFKGMFSSSTGDNLIDSSGFSYEAWLLILEFMYTGDMEDEIPRELLNELYEFGEYLALNMVELSSIIELRKKEGIIVRFIKKTK